MEVLWVAFKGIVIGFGLIILIKLFGLDKRPDDE